jgi:hypothetical protein
VKRFGICALVAGAAAAMAVDSGAPPIVFENTTARSGIHFILDNSATPDKHQPETMIAGVAVFDYNNDGLPDIYFVNGAKLPAMDKSDPRYWNRLYRNNGDGTFTDVTEQAGVKGAGYGMGVAAADYDNDGWVDLYVAGVNANQLFHNNGDGTFTDVTAKAGVAGIDPKLGKLFSISAGWFDYDNDGKLDLFVTNYIRWDTNKEPKCSTDNVRAYCNPNVFEGEPNMLFHNNGDGTFTDVSEKSGIGKVVGKGMGVAFADYDNDGYTDVFVSNDTFRNFLFHNNGNGTFSEVGVTSGVAYNDAGKSIAGMGTDFRDVDNDGKPDIWVVGMINDTFPLFRNTGQDFSDVTEPWGVAKATSRMTAWGAGIYDFDNDGFKDMFAAGGSILDNEEAVDRLATKMPNLVLRNVNGKRFQDVSDEAGVRGAVQQHRGAAFGDFNNDGKVDVVVTCLNAPPELWMNRSAGGNHWLELALRGTKSNRQGLGAKVRVVPETGPVQWNHATTSVGFSSSTDPRVHFGLGAARTAKSIEITWPSGLKQELRNVRTDQVLRVTESK